MNCFDLVCGIIIFLNIGCGLCGNVLSFIIWTKGRRCKKLPGGIYLRALAVSDTAALLIPALYDAIRLLSTLNPKEENAIVCKLEKVGRHYGLIVSSWIIVSFTLERTVAIIRPTATFNVISKKGTVAMMVVIFVVSFLINLPLGIVYKLKQEAVIKPSDPEDSHLLDSNQSEGLETNSTIPPEANIVGYDRKCSADKASLFHLANWYHIWFMDVFLIFIVPFTLLTLSNLIVVYFLVRRRNSMVNKHDSKVKVVSMRAVIISVMHCITSGSFSMSTLFPEFLDTAFRVKYSKEYYGRHITLILAYINHAMNFLLYSFFGTDFRRDCTDLFRKKPSTVHPDFLSQRQKKSSGDDRPIIKGTTLVNTGMELKTGKSIVSFVSTSCTL